MNWGYKITLLLGSFVAFMGYMVYQCVIQDDIHLVSKEYYKKEIAYQDEIDKQKNVIRDQVKPELNYQKGEAVILTFKQKSAKGTIRFFRPADARLDFTQDFSTSSSTSLTIPTKDLASGLWKVKMEWEADGKSYFSEQTLIL